MIIFSHLLHAFSMGTKNSSIRFPTGEERLTLMFVQEVVSAFFLIHVLMTHELCLSNCTKKLNFITQQICKFGFEGFVSMKNLTLL